MKYLIAFLFIFINISCKNQATLINRKIENSFKTYLKPFNEDIIDDRYLLIKVARSRLFEKLNPDINLKKASLLEIYNGKYVGYLQVNKNLYIYRDDFNKVPAFTKKDVVNYINEKEGNEAIISCLLYQAINRNLNRFKVENHHQLISDAGHYYITTIDDKKVETFSVKSFCVLDRKNPNFDFTGPVLKEKMNYEDIFNPNTPRSAKSE